MILYLETNALVAVAEGRDLALEGILDLRDDELALCLPSPCLFEVYRWHNEERRRVEEFARQIDRLVRDWTRDEASVHARPLIHHLEQVRVESPERFAEVSRRLQALIGRLGDPERPGAQVRVLAADAAAIVASLPGGRSRDAMDQLIFHEVIAHASSRPDDEKAVLTSDVAFFARNPDVDAALTAVGVRRWGRASDFLAWFGSR